MSGGTGAALPQSSQHFLRQTLACDGSRPSRSRASGTRRLLANFSPMTLSCSLPATSVSLPEPGRWSHTFIKGRGGPMQRVTASLCYRQAVGLGRAAPLWPLCLPREEARKKPSQPLPRQLLEPEGAFPRILLHPEGKECQILQWGKAGNQPPLLSNLCLGNLPAMRPETCL